MPVILAKSAGFCYGVERAVKLAEQTAREKGGCVMLGSIIHNAHVVQDLEALGARQVDDVSQVRSGETVIKNVFFIIVNNKFFVLYAGITRIRFSGYDLSPK